LISGAISFIVSQHYYEIKWEYRKIGAILFIFFGSAVGMIVLRHTGVSYGMRVVVKLLALAGYSYLGMKLDILTRQNFVIVQNGFFRK